MKTPEFDVTEQPQFKRLVKRLNHVCQNEPIEFVTVALISVYANCAASIEDDATRRGIALSMINGITALEFEDNDGDAEVIVITAGPGMMQ
jgi:hypothetical protein